MPYAYYIALEQADNQRLFNDPENLLRFRCLLRSPDRSNPQGLPVGFVIDKGSLLPPQVQIKERRSMGFTCAACHTGEIHYRGTAMRIDGAPSLTDFDSLTKALEASMVATLTQSAKFDRFAARVLDQDQADAAKRTTLRRSLESAKNEGAKYLQYNHSDVDYGFGRMDAIGRIFNRALEIVGSPDHGMPNAPVSFPFLWDTPRADRVQWTGSLENKFLGPLARNVGEVVGVFATIYQSDQRHPAGLKSSVRIWPLIRLENRVRTLKAPKWPAKVLPAIDEDKAAAGKILFQQQCAKCHGSVNTFPLFRSFTSVLMPVEDSTGKNGERIEGVQTDVAAAATIRESHARTGTLQGAKKGPFSKEFYGETEYVDVITKDTVGRVLAGKFFGFKVRPSSGRVRLGGNAPDVAVNAADMEPDKALIDQEQNRPKLVYRARPLDGIWATAPFLHNGSVPTLYDLLLPENRRPKIFYVGQREFDPVKVGYVSAPGQGSFKFDTSLKSNSNKGHDYGASQMTEQQRWELVEYMKSL